MGTFALYSQSRRVLAALALTLLLAVLALAGLAPPAARGADARVVANAAGRYDTVVLRDLGHRTAALVCMVADGGTFTPQELWRSKAGTFDVGKAKFVVGDVNGDGIGDGIVLYDLGKSRARLSVFLSDGSKAVEKTAWTSKPGAFSWSRARLTVGDVNGDGCDDLVALYDRGHASAALYRFVSHGTKFVLSTGWRARRGTFSCARAQLAAGDVTGDGRDDVLILYGATATSSRLYVFAATANKFVKKTFWHGAYAAGRAQLAAGDVDSDGKCDLICLYRKPDLTGRLDVFLSSKKAFAGPTAWYDGAGGPLPATNCRLAAGDVTGDGRADVVIVQPAGDTTSSVTACVAGASAFEPHVWWEGDWTYPTVRLGVAPSPGMVISDKAKVLDPGSMGALRAVTAGGTMTFAGETAQLGHVHVGDVLLAAPAANFPGGICRKVTAVTDQGGGLQVTTAQATLSDVIDEGEVAFSKRIATSDLSPQGVVAPGVRLITGPAPPGVLPGSPGREFTDGIGFDITTTIAGTAEVEGDVWLDPTTYLDWNIGWTGLNSAVFTQTLATTTDLSVSLKASIDKEIKQEIYKEPLAIITIMVGPLPVVITPEFEVYVGASGKATAGITAGLSINTETSVGVSYDGKDWHHTETATHEITWKKPQLFGGLELKGFVGAGLSFKLYDVVGPYAKLELFEKLEADTSDDPWWTLKAGLDAEIGVKVEALDITLAEVGYTLHLFEFVIDQAGSGTPGDGTGTYHLPSVRGKVLDAGDATTGVESALVELHEGAGAPDGQLVDTAESAGDGSYVFSGIDAGDYTVVASKDGYAQNSRDTTVVADNTATGQDVSIARDATQGVSGTVYTQPGGAPVGWADVSLRQVSEGWWGFTEIDSLTTDADGTFEFTGVPPGDYYLYASHSGYDCFPDRRDVTVAAGQMTTGQDLHLVAWSAQGLAGRVTSALDGSGVEGAGIELREGYDAPCGYLYRTTTTAADGSYAFTGVEPGDYTVVGHETGYVDGQCDTSVAKATVTVSQDFEMAPYVADGVARSVDGADFIRYPMFVGVVDDQMQFLSQATYELWFKLREAVSGTIAQVSLGYGNWPGGASGNGPIMELVVNNQGKLAFYVNEGGSSGPMQNDWQRMAASDWDAGEVEAQVDKWYHLAAEFGPDGLKLFVNGVLRASDPTFTGAPAPDWSDGTLYGGWVSLGDNDTILPGGPSPLASFKELRVSDYERYSGDFEPPDTMTSDAHTLLLDHLIGGTTGEDHGMVWVP